MSAAPAAVPPSGRPPLINSAERPGLEALPRAAVPGKPGTDILLDRSPYFISTTPAGPGERRLACGVVLASAGLFALVAPFASIPLAPVWGFIPIYQAALVINDLMTAVLLFGQFGILHSLPLLVLASAYVFTAGITVAHTLSFPGLFAPTGLLGAGPQTTAWLYMFWHGGFPLTVLAYTLLKERGHEANRPHGRPAAVAVASGAAVLAVVGALTLLATAGHAALPAIMEGHHYTPTMLGTVSTVWGLSLLALVILAWRRPHTILDLWLMVVLCAWLFDIALSAVLNAGRFDVGFYAGRIYGLLSASFVLIVLLLDTGRLYAGLQERSTALAQAVQALEYQSGQLRALASELTLVEQRERSRLAEQIHDGLQQLLVGAKLRLSAASRTGGRDARQVTEEVVRLLDDALADARSLAAELSPPVLRTGGLRAGLEWLARWSAEKYGLAVQIALPPDGLPALPEDLTAFLFQSVREILFNAAKHAHAVAATVTAVRIADELRIAVADSGAGFDLQASRQDGGGGGGLGLTRIRHRLEWLGGTLRVDSSSGRGTCVTLGIAVPDGPATPAVGPDASPPGPGCTA